MGIDWWGPPRRANGWTDGFMWQHSRPSQWRALRKTCYDEIVPTNLNKMQSSTASVKKSRAFSTVCQTHLLSFFLPKLKKPFLQQFSKWLAKIWQLVISYLHPHIYVSVSLAIPQKLGQQAQVACSLHVVRTTSPIHAWSYSTCIILNGKLLEINSFFTCRMF